MMLLLAPETSARLLLGALQMRILGGKGSGNFGHSGRPGERGGSSSEGAAVDVSKFKLTTSGSLSAAGRRDLEKTHAALHARYKTSQAQVDHDALATVVGSGSNYRDISAVLRGQALSPLVTDEAAARTAAEQGIARVDAALSHKDAVAVQAETVFRGFVSATDLEPGTVLEDKSYVAASADPGHAASFATSSWGNDHKYLLQIEVPKGTRMAFAPKAATYVSQAGEVQGTKASIEAQVLFPRGTRMQVQSVSAPQGRFGLRVVKAHVVE